MRDSKSLLSDLLFIIIIINLLLMDRMGSCHGYKINNSYVNMFNWVRLGLT